MWSIPVRCFIAIELDETARHELARWMRACADRARDVRWCSPDQLHVTLQFLGETPASAVTAVDAAARQASSPTAPFSLRLGRIGAFPDARRPRVLWCGLDDPQGGCRRWLSLASSQLAELGYPPESRAFTPHVTLARSRSAEDSRQISALLTGTAAPAAIEFDVRHITLFESVLRPGGPRYVALSRTPLGTSA